MSEKFVIFGRVFKFYSPNKGKDFFKIEYLDEDGVTHSDLITQESYYKINSKSIKPGTLVRAFLELNQYNRGEIVDCTTE